MNPERLTHLVLHHPKKIFIGLVLLTVLTAAMMPLIQVDTDPENMLPENQAQRVFHNQVKARFNLSDLIVVGAVNRSEQGIFNPQSLQALLTVANQIEAIEGVIAHDLMALSHVDNITQQGPGTIRFEWLMKQAPVDQPAAVAIAEQVARLPLLQNTMVSEDLKAASIYVPIADKNESHRIATEIQTIIAGVGSTDEYHITGLPVAEDTFGYQMFIQMGISAPLAGLMIFVLMWVFFRNLKFIAAPMVVAMATVIIIMGTMIGMGYTVHIMSSMIAIFLMPIAVVDSIHILSEFVENYEADEDRETVIGQVLNNLFKPMLFTSLTSSVGFFSLLLTPIPPVQIFGAFVGMGILLAFVLTLVFVPAYLAVLKPAALQSLRDIHHSRSGLLKGVKRLGQFSLTHSKAMVLLFLVLLAISVLGVLRIQINDNPVRWFKAEHPIRVADRVLNEHFAGTYDAYLVLESDRQSHQQQFMSQLADGSAAEQEMTQLLQRNPDFTAALTAWLFWAEDQLFAADDAGVAELEPLMVAAEQTLADIAAFKQPANLAYVERLQQALQDSGLVGKSNSLADVVKTVYRELMGGAASDFRLPPTAAGVAQALLQYQSSHRPHDLWHFVSQDHSSSLIWVQLTSGDNQDMSLVVNHMDQFLADNPPPAGVSVAWAGKTFLNKVWQEEMVMGMGMSLVSAFVVVFVMMVVLFRSLLFGVLAMLPLTLTIAFIYGLIGWVGKDYDMPIAVLSALTLGLSVDFAIHFLQRARDLYQETNDFKQTMQLMFEEPAAAISKNAVVIAIGFTPLLLAPLVPYITVGFFLATIMAVSALVTLMMLPALLKILVRWAFGVQR
ncbi:efflux RND transporter permease subunit [Marinicella meishanensis]|uniref:efflux RND transporter permease subunit n=1 Tax=Marinicella meishanensis TaxID=2873263 RepID=UPI001CBD833F|nr:MMPL family transporter [Marinicella sp. NBU2979]